VENYFVYTKRNKKQHIFKPNDMKELNTSRTKATLGSRFHTRYMMWITNNENILLSSDTSVVTVCTITKYEQILVNKGDVMGW